MSTHSIHVIEKHENNLLSESIRSAKIVVALPKQTNEQRHAFAVVVESRHIVVWLQVSALNLDLTRLARHQLDARVRCEPAVGRNNKSAATRTLTCICTCSCTCTSYICTKTQKSTRGQFVRTVMYVQLQLT